MASVLSVGVLVLTVQLAESRGLATVPAHIS